MPVVITSERNDGVRVLTLRGQPDPQTASDLSASLAATASETLRVAVDVRDIPRLDLATGRLLLVSACAIRERGGRLAAIVKRGTPTADLLEELGADDDFDVVDAVGSALTSLARTDESPRSARPQNVVSIHRMDGLTAASATFALDALTYREGKILEWRFGLYGTPRVDYREIAERLGMQAAGVRETERRALATVSKGSA